MTRLYVDLIISKLDIPTENANWLSEILQ